MDSITKLHHALAYLTMYTINLPRDNCIHMPELALNNLCTFCTSERVFACLDACLCVREMYVRTLNEYRRRLVFGNEVHCSRREYV